MTDKPFKPKVSDILGGVDFDELEALAEVKYEDGIVNGLFIRYNLDRNIKYAMLHRHEREFGYKQLTLAAFHEEFPEFPMFLFARKFPKIRKDTPVHRLFSDFARRKFTKEYLELADEVPDEWGGPVGLVFFWPYIKVAKMTKGQGLVLHDWEFAPEVPGVTLTWISQDKKPIRLTLEPLQILLKRIDKASSGRMWSPDA